MIVLSLDSSADALSVALLRDGDPLAERFWRAPRPHAEALLPAVEGALGDARVTFGEVGLVAVATGPGSFNGIRGGISVAQGLVLALDIPAVGIPTLDALSYAHVGRAEVVCAVLPAGRGEFYSASYSGDWQRWDRLGAYSVGPLDTVLEGLPAGALLCGRLPDGIAESASARGLVCVPAAVAAGGARLVGALAALRSAAEDFDAAASLTALYLRRPGITTPNRRHQNTVS